MWVCHQYGMVTRRVLITISRRTTDYNFGSTIKSRPNHHGPNIYKQSCDTLVSVLQKNVTARCGRNFVFALYMGGTQSNSRRRDKELFSGSHAINQGADRNRALPSSDLYYFRGWPVCFNIPQGWRPLIRVCWHDCVSGRTGSVRHYKKRHTELTYTEMTSKNRPKWCGSVNCRHEWETIYM